MTRAEAIERLRADLADARTEHARLMREIQADFAREAALLRAQLDRVGWELAQKLAEIDRLQRAEREPAITLQ